MSGGVTWPEALEAWRAAAPAPPRICPLPLPDLLKGFHPDQRPGGMDILAVGANAGNACPTELAALLQSDALIEDIDLAGAPILDADVLVLGGGGAGCVAALSAARSGARVLIATKLRLGDGNTVMAEGGIQAALGAEDSLQRHFEDTLRAGHFVADKALVAALEGDGPDAIRWLIQEGMSFDLVDERQRMGDEQDIGRDCHRRAQQVEQLDRGDGRVEQHAAGVAVKGDQLGGAAGLQHRLAASRGADQARGPAVGLHPGEAGGEMRRTLGAGMVEQLGELARP